MKIAGVAIAMQASGTGLARWRSLADAALAELGPSDAPIIIGSCNGAADELDAASWSRAFAELGNLPIASAACASGLHALWVAQARLAHDCDEVIVLASDIVSPASHGNFETLRVLDDTPAPWQPTSGGFREGEAAVAIRLQRGAGVVGPLLGNDNLAALVTRIGTEHVAFAIGQGTGPASVDARELAALPPHVPIATALASCGHTIGASGLLSVALATGARADLLAMPVATAMDGRPLGVPRDARGDVLVMCRALGGACAVVKLGDGDVRQRSCWVEPQPAPAMRLPLLRRIAALPRPATLPDAIVVRLDAPLAPPEDARIGTRLLPSVVLEITPGFLSQLVSSVWGFCGPAVTLVGGSDEGWVPTLAAIRHVHGEVLVLHVHGRDFEWGT
ncbi:MAG: hypothetical protein M4D80_08760 [Myxococcota bacterium]|nr:hypothetical protein [Myxococcota bacterium]